MNDSADMQDPAGTSPGLVADNGPTSEQAMKTAAQRLTSTLDILETRIGTLANRMRVQSEDISRLSAEVAQSEHFKSDRAELAARLDTVMAESRENESRFASREREFDALARRTEDEISAIAAQVDAAMQGEG